MQKYYDDEEKRLLNKRKDIMKQIRTVDKKQEEWYFQSKETFNFACSAKYQFEAGDVRTKTYVLSKLGSNLTILDRSLQISGDRPYFLIEKAKKEIQEVILALEPAEKAVISSNLLAYEPISSILLGLVWVELDLTSDDSIKKAASEIKKHTDKLDLLVNNAGLNKDSATNDNKELVSNLEKLDRESLSKMFDVNTIAPLLLTKELLPLLSNTDSFVINISSCRASYNDEYENSNANYGYRASKSALNMMTYASTWDLPKNVRIFSVHPGGVKTDMNPGGKHDSYEQAKKMISITKNWKDEFNGKFLRFDGKHYPL